MSQLPSGTVQAEPDRCPTVTVGMPAYNAARTIRSSIDSLLAQSFSDFELIISDNASTDETWSIIEDYARNDRRVVAIRQTHNIGANGNYSAVVRLARGRYFKWASSNDWCAPQFLSSCIAYLERSPETVLVAPRTRLFETAPDACADYDGDMAFDQDDPVTRFVQVYRCMRLNNLFNGVMRISALRRTRLVEHYPGADIVLVAHMALLGKVALLDDYLFYRRMDRETATRLMSVEAVHRHHYPSKTLRALFPAWRFAAGSARAAVTGSPSVRDSARALTHVARMAYWNWTGLASDVVEALRQPMRG